MDLSEHDILEDPKLSFGQGKHMCHFPGRQSCAHAHHDRSGPRDRQGSDGPVDPVGHPKGDTIPRADSERGEALCQLTGALFQRGESDCFFTPTNHQKLTVAKALGGTLKNLEYVGYSLDRDAIFSAHAIWSV